MENCHSRGLCGNNVAFRGGSSEEPPRPMKYISETYMKWKQMYIEALENKQAFVKAHEHDFYSAFVQHAEEFAKEIFLDPTHCENPCFALP